MSQNQENFGATSSGDRILKPDSKWKIVQKFVRFFLPVCGEQESASVWLIFVVLVVLGENHPRAKKL